jgi:hypothetical protein
VREGLNLFNSKYWNSFRIYLVCAWASEWVYSMRCHKYSRFSFYISFFFSLFGAIFLHLNAQKLALSSNIIQIRIFFF